MSATTSATTEDFTVNGNLTTLDIGSNRRSGGRSGQAFAAGRGGPVGPEAHTRGSEVVRALRSRARSGVARVKRLIVTVS